jgi:hypothetical protein
MKNSPRKVRKARKGGKREIKTSLRSFGVDQSPSIPVPSTFFLSNSAGYDISIR